MGREGCAVFGCQNRRSHPERNIIKEHVTHLRFHRCPERYYQLWTKLLGWANWKASASTAVCSNHFRHGQPYPADPHPTMFLRGYDTVEKELTRGPPKKRELSDGPPTNNCKSARGLNAGNLTVPGYSTVQLIHGHDYTSNTPCHCNQLTCVLCGMTRVAQLQKQIQEMQDILLETKNQLEEAKETIKKLTSPANHFSINQISHSNDLVKMYTGLPSYSLFQWVLSEVRPNAQNIKYHKGTRSAGHKKYESRGQDRPGKKRSLSIEDELLITLMKLRLNLNQVDLSVRFGVAQSTISQILSTWIPFLATELKALIYWPTKKQIYKYYPTCFKTYDGCVKCIIDCTEIKIHRPSLALSNNQVYSQYKSAPTLKILVGITPGGTISYISKPVGGCASDKQVVNMSGFIDLLEEGDSLLADRGFNIQELLLQKQVKLHIPPFTRTTSSTHQFTEEENCRTKVVANSRIHVERAIGRLKEFMILQGPISLNMIDIIESALIVCAAIVNLQPVLVPLRPK